MSALICLAAQPPTAGNGGNGGIIQQGTCSSTDPYQQWN
jgi:hypothetical protein